MRHDKVKAYSLLVMSFSKFGVVVDCGPNAKAANKTNALSLFRSKL